jgi:hypothetical protein
MRCKDAQAHSSSIGRCPWFKPAGDRGGGLS